MQIEACVDDLRSAVRAAEGGANRVELCDNLADAGTTPSHGVLAFLLERLSIPAFPIIRARGGGFVYDADEIDAMRRDVAHAGTLGATGMVIGALTPEGQVDREAVARLRAEAPQAEFTFHRAFDVCRDPHEALDTLVALGVRRVLTSGQRPTAWEGRHLLRALVEAAADRIIILAGSGIDEENVAALVAYTGVREVHVRGTSPVREPADWSPHPVIPFRKAPPEDESVRLVTDPERISAIRRALSA